MSRSLTILLAGLMALTSVVSAQEEHHPQISIAHPGVKRLNADMALMLELATKKEQPRQDWRDIIEAFAFGVDFEKPLRADLLSGLVPSPMIVHIPYTEKGDDLLANIDTLMGTPIPEKGAPNLYQTDKNIEPGWVKLTPAPRWAVVGVSQKVPNQKLIGQIVKKAISPEALIGQILEGDASLGVRLHNATHDTESIAKRRKSFEAIRTLQLDALQQRPKESTTEFGLRVGLARIYLNELERLLIESDVARSRTWLNKTGPTSNSEFDVTAIDGTGFAKSMSLFADQQDAFASVESDPKSALSLRLNHPIDELRTASAEALVKLIRADVANRLEDSSVKLTDAQKAASQKLFDGAAQIVLDGIRGGHLNGFLESVPVDDTFSTYGCTVVPGAGKLPEVLALIAESGEGNEADLNAHKVGDVSIHRVKLRKGFLTLFDFIFGEGAEAWLGTSDDRIWFATGPGSLDRLKAAIAGLGEPGKAEHAISVSAQLLPWVQRSRRAVEGLPKPTDAKDQEARREVLLRLTHAVEALKPTDDDITFVLDVNDGKMVGKTTVNTGLLRLVGKELAFFAEHNLR